MIRRFFFFIIAIAAALILLSMMIGRMASSIQDMPVYVMVRTNPPPQFVSALGGNTNWFVSIPYAQAADKLVTEDDLKKIKQTIPRSKTVGRLFRPGSLVIESSTHASADFWRRRTRIGMSLIKTGEVWRVEDFGRSGRAEFVTPPGIMDKLEKRIPF